MTKVTSKEIIEKKLLAFYDKMNRIAAFLQENGAPDDIQIDPKEMYLECYIDKPAIARLLKISMQDGFEQFGVFLGLEEPGTRVPQSQFSNSFGRVTTCFLGLDKDQNILGCHFPKPSPGKSIAEVIDGEDTWPPPPPPGVAMELAANLPYDPKKAFTLDSCRGDIRNYFEKGPAHQPPAA